MPSPPSRLLVALAGISCLLAPVSLPADDPGPCGETVSTPKKSGSSPTPAPATRAGDDEAPPLQVLAPGVFQLGLVRAETASRTVHIPAVVNLRDGPIEYLLVTLAGKTHESLLRTEAKPFQIKTALLLLGAKGTTNALPLNPAKAVPGDPIHVELRFRDEAAPGTAAAAAAPARAQSGESFVTDRRAAQPMTPGPWRFNGSRLRPDGFAADIDGSIISLITDPDALINNPRPGREDDDNWLVRPQNLPPLNSPVTVLLKLPPSPAKNPL